MSCICVFGNFCASTDTSRPAGRQPHPERNAPLRSHLLYGYQSFREGVCRYRHHPERPAHIGRPPGAAETGIPLPDGRCAIGRWLSERRGRLYGLSFPPGAVLSARSGGFHAAVLLLAGGPFEGPAGRGGERRHRTRGNQEEDGYLLDDGAPDAGERKPQAGLCLGTFSGPLGRGLSRRFEDLGGVCHLCRSPRSLRLYEYGPGHRVRPLWR